jgi:hypothetical protein
VLADNEEGVDLSAEDFVDKLWLLSITLLLIMISIMISGENLIEHVRLEKKRKPKSGEGKPLEFWSPNFLGRLYQSTIAKEAGNRSASTQRLHWRRGHIKSQPHGPGHSLRKAICIRPSGRDGTSIEVVTHPVKPSTTFQQENLYFSAP